jgi:hypothetical protein
MCFFVVVGRMEGEQRKKEAHAFSFQFLYVILLPNSTENG